MVNDLFERLYQDVLFYYIHPLDAHALSLSSRVFNHLIKNTYRSNDQKVVHKNGSWHHKLCKRAKESIEDTFRNWKPKAIASLLDSKCAICGKKYMASCSVWGMMAHSDCVRPYLLNTYYLQDMYGFDYKDIKQLPKETLSGYSGGRHGVGQYDYDVVINKPSKGLFPRDWCLKVFIKENEHAKVIIKEFLENKKRKQEKIQEEDDRILKKRFDLDEKRKEAVEIRKKRLLKKDSYAYNIITSISTSFPNKLDLITQDFFHNKITVSTNITTVISNAYKAEPLLKVFNIEDIYSLDASIDEIAHTHVKKVLDDLVDKTYIIDKTYDNGKSYCRRMFKRFYNNI